MSDFTRRDLLRTGLALSTGSLVMRGSDALAAAGAGAAALPAAHARTVESAAAVSPRERLLFDFGWKFHLGCDSPALRDLGAGDGLDAFSKTGAFALATEGFDDSAWRSLDLPHDWAVELPFVRFDIPASDANRRIVLEFDGVFRSAAVFLNGCYLGRKDSGYVPFQFDVSDFLNHGGRNFVVARVDATYGEGWFYEGAGIYRHVWLTKTDRLHLGDADSVVRCRGWSREKRSWSWKPASTMTARLRSGRAGPVAGPETDCAAALHDSNLLLIHATGPAGRC